MPALLPGPRAYSAVRDIVGRWLTRRIVQCGGVSRLGLAAMIWAVAVSFAGGARAIMRVPPKPSQGQVAGQFLRAVLRADYVAAYQYVAPEMRRAVSLERFTAAARPLHQRASPRRTEIRLYKLGVRLGAGQASRLFYSFAFAADSALKTPSVLLEVTFRDTAARAVLGFGLRGAGPSPTRAKAGAASGRRAE